MISEIITVLFFPKCHFCPPSASTLVLAPLAHSSLIAFVKIASSGVKVMSIGRGVMCRWSRLHLPMLLMLAWCIAKKPIARQAHRRHAISSFVADEPMVASGATF